MKLIGDPQLGPFCPFRGIRIKSFWHRWLGRLVLLLITLAVIGVAVVNRVGKKA